VDDDGADFNTTGQDLAGRVSRLGLPNFAQNSSSPPQAPGITINNPCFGQDTEFVAIPSSTIDDVFIWTFDDQVNETLSPSDVVCNADSCQVFEEFAVIRYDTDSLHVVELEIQNRCLRAIDSAIIFVDTINIASIDEEPVLSNGESLCFADEVLELEAWFDSSRTDLSYSWVLATTEGVIRDSSRVFEIREFPGQFADISVSITNLDGCSSADSATIVNNRPQLDLGRDQLLCQNELVPDLLPSTGDPSALSFEWTVNGSELNLPDTLRALPIETSIPGDYVYQLEVSIRQGVGLDQFAGCSNRDSIFVSVQDSPEVSSIPTEPTNCGTADATLAFNVDSPGSYAYSLSGNGLSATGSIDGPDSSPLFDGLRSGNYQLAVTNLVSGCTTFDPISIEDDANFDVTATNLPSCNIDVNLGIAVTGLAVPERVNVYITNLLGDTVSSESEIFVPVRRFPLLDSGVYFVNVEDVLTNCFRADTVLIDPYLPGVDDCTPKIIAPNAFSPNGNGFNEEFFIYPSPFIDEFEVFIYTRWGELIFYSTDENFRWDGTFNGQELGPGTFAYIMQFTSREEPGLGTLVQYGSITLIK
jgi:gliding motility-associated-like protein